MKVSLINVYSLYFLKCLYRFDSKDTLLNNIASVILKSLIRTILAKSPWDTWQNDNWWRIFLKWEVIV